MTRTPRYGEHGAAALRATAASLLDDARERGDQDWPTVNWAVGRMLDRAADQDGPTLPASLVHVPDLEVRNPAREPWLADTPASPAAAEWKRRKATAQARTRPAAEALRDAADACYTDTGPTHPLSVADWLRERADRLERTGTATLAEAAREATGDPDHPDTPAKRGDAP